MKKKMKKIIAVVCAIAMVVSSMTIYSNTTAKADDYSALEYTKVEAGGLTGTYAYCITNNSMTGFSHLNFYSAFSDLMQMIGSGDSKFAASTVTVNGEEVEKYHTWFDKSDAIYGTNVGELPDNAYYAYKVVSDGGTLEFVLKKGNPDSSEPIETTTESPITDGTEILLNTDFNGADNWNHYGFSSSVDNGDGSVFVGVPAYTAGNNYDSQLVQNGITLKEGKWYVATVSVSSDVAKKIQLLIQSDGVNGGDWSVINDGNTDFSVSAGETVTHTVKFKADNVKNKYLFGIMMGYTGTSSEAAKITVSNVSLKIYNEEPEITSVTVEPVMNVRATGGTKTIDVTWDYPTEVKEGTKYYVYLDDADKESAIVDTNNATLTDVPSGQHIVKVKAYYAGVFSTVAVSPQTTVYGEATAVAQLAVASQKANTVQVQWHYEANATYKIELVNAAGETVATITDTTVDGTLGKCEFTDVAKGTYTVKATAIYGETVMEAVVSNEITVENVQPANVSTLDCDVETVEQIGLTWTVNNETEGQTYKVYLDDEEVATLPAKTYAYTLENVKPGVHAVKVTAVYGEYETEGLVRNIIVKAAPVTKFDTELTQVDIVSGVVKLDDTWSYEFASQSADSFVGISADGALIAYLPTYVNAAVDRIYENVTGLEIGKTYTYTYTILTDVDGNNIPVTASMAGGYSDGYELVAVPADGGVTVTKKFTATAATMKLDYTLGWVNNSASVKISKAVIEELQPTEVSNLKAEGGIEGMNLSWESENAVEEQAYNIYLNGSDTPVATGIKDKSYSVAGIAEGTYSVTVKAVLNGVETAGVTVENVEVSKMGAAITSESVMVEGFQIKTNNTTDTVGFRTVCKAPNKGSQIVANNGKTYTVESMGTIYTLDTNYNGYRRNDVLNASYTLLNPTAVSGQTYTYVGANKYDGAQRTFGYVATDAGIAKDWNTSDSANTYYVRTMNGMSANNMLEYSIHVRAFVVATDGTIIYGKKTACISVAEVADYLYKNSKSKNFTAHKYLYSSILTKVANTNPYYRDSTLSYGWDSQLFTPANPTFSLTEGTLDELNGKN